MPNDFVEKTIRRLNLRLILISLVFLLIVMVGLIASQRLIHNLVSGPFPISQDELLTLTDPTARWEYYVKVAGDDNANTGFTYVSTSDTGKETTEAYYHALQIYDRLLLVKAKGETITNTVNGTLVKLSSIETDQVIAPLVKDFPNLRGVFLTVMLDATGFNDSWFGLGLAGVVGLAALFGLLLGFLRMANPQTHPAMKALKDYGELETVVHDIDLNMSAPHTQVGKKVHFINRWLVSTKTGFNAVPYKDIIWAYKKITQHRTNGIPTGKTYAALVNNRYGKQMVIAARENEVDSILQNISTAAPGTLIGYSDNLSAQWQKDRALVISSVDEARTKAGIF